MLGCLLPHDACKRRIAHTLDGNKVGRLMSQLPIASITTSVSRALTPPRIGRQMLQTAAAAAGGGGGQLILVEPKRASKEFRCLYKKKQNKTRNTSSS